MQIFYLLIRKNFLVAWRLIIFTAIEVTVPFIIGVPMFLLLMLSFNQSNTDVGIDRDNPSAFWCQEFDERPPAITELDIVKSGRADAMDEMQKLYNPISLIHEDAATAGNPFIQVKGYNPNTNAINYDIFYKTKNIELFQYKTSEAYIGVYRQFLKNIDELNSIEDAQEALHNNLRKESDRGEDAERNLIGEMECESYHRNYMLQFLPLVIGFLILPIWLNSAYYLAAEFESEIWKYLNGYGISNRHLIGAHVVVAVGKSTPFLIGFVISLLIVVPPGMAMLISASLILLTMWILLCAMFVAMLTRCALPTVFVNVTLWMTSMLLMLLTRNGYYDNVRFLNYFELLNPLSAFYCVVKGVHTYEMRGHGDMIGALHMHFKDILPPVHAFLFLIVDLLVMVICLLLHYFKERILARISPQPDLTPVMKPFEEPGTPSMTLAMDSVADELPNALVRLEDVTKIWSETGEVGVRNVTFAATINEATVILGQHSSGKSTLLSLLSGTTRLTSGVLSVVNSDLTSNVHRLVGYMPQRNYIFPHLTAHDHMWFYHSLRRGTTNLKKEKALYDEKLALGKSEHKFANKLSSSKRRQLMFACAVIGEVPIVLLDEPTRGLDADMKTKIAAIIADEKKERLIIATTSDPDEAESWADRIYVMHRGILLARGLPAIIKQQAHCGTILCIDLQPGAVHSNVMNAIQKVMPGAVQRPLDTTASTKMEIVLPPSIDDSDKIPQLLFEVEKERDYLHIEKLSLKMETIDEAFKRLVDLSEVNNYENIDEMLVKDPNADEVIESITTYYGKRTLFQMYKWALQRCRFSVIALQFLLPMLLLVTFQYRVVTHIDLGSPDSNHFKAEYFANGRFQIQYDETSNFSMSNKTKIEGILANGHNIKIDYGPCDKVSSVYPWTLGCADTTTGGNSQFYAIKYSTLSYLAVSALADVVANGNNTRNDTPKVTSRLRVLWREPEGMPLFVAMAKITAGFTIAMILVFAQFSRSPTDERVSDFKKHQELAGLSRLSYWTTTFAFDSSAMLVFALLAASALSLASHCHVPFAKWLLYIVLLIPPGLTQAYFASTLFKRFATNFAIPVIFNFAFFIVIYPIAAFTVADGPIYLFGILNPFLAVALYVVGDVIKDVETSIVVLIVSPLLHALLYAILICVMEERKQSLFKRAKKEKPKMIDEAVKKEHAHIKNSPDGLVFKFDEVTMTYDYVTNVLKGVTFGVTEGELVAVLGSSGTGKTSLVRLIARDCVPTHGLIHFNGAPHRKGILIGYCPDHDAVMPDLTLRQQMEIIASLNGYVNVGLHVDELLRQLDLKAYANRYPKQLSSQQLRRLRIAMGLLTTANAIVMDDPFAGLDALTTRVTWALLFQARGDGKTVFLTTSRAKDCLLADRTAVLSEGELVAINKMDDIKQKYGQIVVLSIALDKTQIENRVEMVKIVSSIFPNARLSDLKGTRILRWHLPLYPPIPLSILYKKMKEAAGRIMVKEFSIMHSCDDDVHAALNLTILPVEKIDAKAPPPPPLHDKTVTVDMEDALNFGSKTKNTNSKASTSIEKAKPTMTPTSTTMSPGPQMSPPPPRKRTIGTPPLNYKSNEADSSMEEKLSYKAVGSGRAALSSDRSERPTSPGAATSQSEQPNSEPRQPKNAKEAPQDSLLLDAFPTNAPPETTALNIADSLPPLPSAAKHCRQLPSPRSVPESGAEAKKP